MTTQRRRGGFRRGTRRSGVPRPAIRVVAVGVLLALTAAACSAGQDATQSEGEAPAMDGGMDRPQADAGGPAAPEPGRAGDLGGSLFSGGSVGRQLVRSAQLVLEVRDSEVAAREVTAIAERSGGFVAETDLARDADGVVRGSIGLRVPSAVLLDVVQQLDELAVAVPVRRIDETDVTTEVTDLRAQRTNLTAYETELRALLTEVRQKTARTEDLLAVFDRVNAVRAEIDWVTARLAVLEDQVALARVDVTLRPAASARPITNPGWDPGETARAALATTARALSTIADFAIRAALIGLPVMLVLALPLTVAWAWWRRRPRTAAPPPPPGGTVEGS